MGAWLTLTGALPAVAVLISISRFRASTDQAVRGGFLLILALLTLVTLLTGAHLAQPADFFSWLAGGLIVGPSLYFFGRLALSRAERTQGPARSRRVDPVALPFDPGPFNGQSVAERELPCS